MKYVRGDYTQANAVKLKEFLRNAGIYFETSGNGDLVHFEVKVNARQLAAINRWIDINII